MSSKFGQACGCLYQCSQIAGSLIRKSAARSITFTPASKRSGTICIAVPFGAAKNTQSQFFKPSKSGLVKTKSRFDSKLGYKLETFLPASLREVTTLISTIGCETKKRSNSTPV